MDEHLGVTRAWVAVAGIVVVGIVVETVVVVGTVVVVVGTGAAGVGIAVDVVAVACDEVETFGDSFGDSFGDCHDLGSSQEKVVDADNLALALVVARSLLTVVEASKKLVGFGADWWGSLVGLVEGLVTVRFSEEGALVLALSVSFSLQDQPRSSSVSLQRQVVDYCLHHYQFPKP